MTRRIAKRMYAVSKKGVGIISGTMAYSRRRAIEHFVGSSYMREWGDFKRDGYRTVVADIILVEKPR